MDDKTVDGGYEAETYWSERYSTWASEPYDWLFSWADVEHVIVRFVARDHSLLLPGCGNQPLSPDMYDAGTSHNDDHTLLALVLAVSTA